MIALHDASLCATPKNALLGSAQTHATDLGRLILIHEKISKTARRLTASTSFR